MFKFKRRLGSFIKMIVLLQAIIKETDEVVNQLDGVTSVHQRFYELSSNYYKLIIDYANYYRDSLRYLGCIKLEDVPGLPYNKLQTSHFTIVSNMLSILEADLADRAFSLCLAAILGKNVYNFGELVLINIHL